MPDNSARLGLQHGKKPHQKFTGAMDIYGGYTELPVSGGATGKFRVGKIGNRWVFATPLGNAFWMRSVQTMFRDDAADTNGVNMQTTLIAKYTSGGPTSNYVLNWVNQMGRRLQAWGFNTWGEYIEHWAYPTEVNTDWAAGDNTPPIKFPFYSVGESKMSRVVGLNPNSVGSQSGKAFPTGFKKSKGNITTDWNNPPFRGVCQSIDPYDTNFQPIVNDWFQNHQFIIDCDTGPNNDYFMGFMSDDSDSFGMTRAGQDYQTIRNGTLESAPGSGGLHFGWVTLASAPTQGVGIAANDDSINVDTLFPDAQFYAKSALATWLQDAAGGNYSTIGALNTAWGSSYSSFGTAGTTVTAEAGFTGAINGVNKTFTKTLAHVPSPLSVQVVVDGTIVAGDDASGPTAGTATTTGSFAVGATGASTINYTTGAVSIVLNVAPVTSFSVNYIYGGWGSGSGLLDEDGSGSHMHSATTLSGQTAQMKVDLNGFLQDLSKTYHAGIKSAIDTYRPGRLYFGVSGLGGWGTPSWAAIYAGAAPYVDIITLPGLPCGFTNDQARMDFVITACGVDKPFINWEGFPAQVDSEWPALTPSDNPVGNFSTQELRGAFWTAQVNRLLTLRGTSDGVAHYIGFQWWNPYDQRGESTNWGFITNKDNPYDGVADKIATGTDQWGYATGGEVYNCGDFLTAMIAANATVFGEISS